MAEFSYSQKTFKHALPMFHVICDGWNFLTHCCAIVLNIVMKAVGIWNYWFLESKSCEVACFWIVMVIKLETELILIALRHKIIRTECIKINRENEGKWNVDNVDINTIRDSSKLVQKEDKNKHDWVGEMLDRKLCKKTVFWTYWQLYMHRSGPVLKKEKT